MIRTRVEGRKVYNIVYITLITIILLSMFWTDAISILLYLKPNYVFSNDTEVHFIDVGQGDAICIKFNNEQTMLIDSGIEDAKAKLFRYLDKIILNDKGRIDYFVLTHIDNDHSGNLIDILNHYQVVNLYLPKIDFAYSELPDYSKKLYDNILKEAQENNCNIFFNYAGNTLNVGDAYLKWLYPVIDKSIAVSNDYSAVIRLEYNDKAVLFTGDIGSNVEEKLLDTYSNDVLDVDILKIAHHGSANSTSLDFLKATTPEFAGVSVGENTYGHPANSLISRVMEYDSDGFDLYDNLFTTLERGNIIFSLSENIIVNFIDNIDNYLFVSYIWFCMIAIIVLLYFMLLPYYKALRKDIRFVIQNKRFKKHLKEEQL